ncbi:protein kinase domain-containing protein [Streptomyces sp. NBC_00076]|uniref:protein kinase domain-containing protein n=1 Tax=Streptomyces sp. NBC_00076 TaxID=2975642 RepID=UPI0032541C07
MSSGEHERADEVGRLLAGRYRVVAQLGRGGMGVVWRAVDEVLGREVAVKELRTYTDADGPELAGLRLRMQREARAAARVRHPGVVAVHDVAEVDGRPLIIMELVDGPSLDGVLRERGTLDPREAAGIGAEVMDALVAAHRAGVLHRDVKPGNILLDRSGRVVLTDFGIAKVEDPGDGSATHLTRSGELVGSLDYLAPERAQGADPGPASDIWALGATLFAAVEGSSPFRRTSTFSTLTAIVTEPLPEPRRAGHLGPVLRRLLDKRPESRPGAEEARDLLRAVADTAGTDTPTTTLRGSVDPAPARTETGRTETERTETGPTERSVPAAPPGFGPVEPVGPGGPAGRELEATGQGAPGEQGTPLPAPGAPAAHGTGGPGATGPTVHGGPTSHGGQPETTGRSEATGQPETTGQPDPTEQIGVPGQAGPTGRAGHTGHPGPGVPPGPHAHGFGAPAPAGSEPAATGPMSASGPSASGPTRRKAVVLAAAAATVVLVAAGATVAVLDLTGDASADNRPTASVTSAAASAAADRADAERSDSPEPTDQGDGKNPTATQSPGAEPGTETADRATTSSPAKTSGSGTTTGGGTSGGSSDGDSGDGGTTGGGGTGGGGTETTQAPACHSIGGGKYNCEVWRTADSYTDSGAEAGVLNAGTNYFYCQQNLGRRETYGQWTNVWWAKTDDDSGNTNVYVSDVYIKGGDNDSPIPGLPVC